MHRNIRYAAALLCALVLSGCKISTTSLGSGSIKLVSDNASPCISEAGCFEGGYNRAVTFRAEPAAGFEFAGWAGDCRGMGDCTVHTAGNRHVIASFKTRDAIVPLMDYTRNFFFSGPWPTDLRRSEDGTLDLTDFPDHRGIAHRQARNTASAAAGFARNGGLFIPLATAHAESFDTQTPQFTSHADQHLQLVSLDDDDTATPQRIPVTVQFHHDDSLEEDSLLFVKPLTGHALSPDTTYALILFVDDSASLYGLPTAQASPMQALIAGAGTGKLAEQWEKVRQHVTQHSAFPPEKVAAFTVFTTAPEPAVYSDITSYLDGLNPEEHLLATDFEFYQTYRGENYECDSRYLPNAIENLNRVHAVTTQLTLPSFIRGKPPYTLGGGGLNYDEQGRLAPANDGTLTRLLVVIPCSTPPATGWPVEITGLPTGHTVDDYIQNYLGSSLQNQRTVQVIVPAPITGDREYPEGTEDFSRASDLLGIEEQFIAVALGDFNPLNMQATFPQHVQYGADMVFALRFLQQGPALLQSLLPYLEQYSDTGINKPALLPFANLQIDKANITFRGESLGAIAALHATRISGENRNVVLSRMPSPSAYHLNNIAEFVTNETGPTAINIIEAVLGINFPMDLTSPFVTLLQTGIDTVDVTNRIDDLEGKNILLNMEWFTEPLHGGETSYAFATALDQRYGIVPVLSQYSRENRYPIGQFVQTSGVKRGSYIWGKPTRVVSYSDDPDFEAAVNSFTYQMSRYAAFYTGFTSY